APGNIGRVLEYDGTTGDLIRTFVSAGSGNVGFIDGITFGPDNNLYLTCLTGADAGSVKMYDGTTGDYLGNFVAPHAGGISQAVAILFYDDGSAPHGGTGRHHTTTDSAMVSASLETSHLTVGPEINQTVSMITQPGLVVTHTAAD